MKITKFFWVGVIVSLLISGLVIHFASPNPDGLESVIIDGCEFDAEGEVINGECIAQSEADHEVGGPLSDYEASFINNEKASMSVAGIVGTIVTLLVATGLFWVLAKRRNNTDTTADDKVVTSNKAME